jgi:LuxR family quorum sensing-dependent transcriptional regulator
VERRERHATADELYSDFASFIA